MNEKEPSRKGDKSGAQLPPPAALLLGLHEISRCFHRETDACQLCGEVARQLADRFGLAAVWIGRALPANRELICEALAGPEPALFSPGLLGWDAPLVAEVWRTGSPVVRPAARSGEAALALFPLSYRGHTLGLLALQDCQPAAFAPAVLPFLAGFADDLARAWHALEAETDFARTRESFETLVEALPDAIFFKDGEGRWRVVNSLGKVLFQLLDRPWQGRTDLEMAADLPALRDAHLACQASDEQAWAAARITNSEETVTGPDGRAHTFDVVKVPLFHPDGRRKGLVIVGRDVTAERQTRHELWEANQRLAQLNSQLEARVAERTRQLAESEEIFRTIADSATSAIFMLDRAACITFWNRAAAEIFGWPAAEALGQELNRLLGLDEGALPLFLPRRNSDPHSWRRLEATARRRDGEYIPLELSLAAIQVRGSDYLVGMANDISERRRAEQELERYAWEVEDLYNRAPCGYHSLDVRGCILRINHTELNWLGYTREEMVGRPLTEFYTPASQEFFHKNFLGFTGRDHELNAELELIRKDGSTLPVVINSVAVRDAAGGFLHTRTTVFDDTERRRTRQEIQRALELADSSSRAKTDFLAHVSHEIRTPMNAIMGYAQLLRRHPGLPETASSQAEIICRNGQNLLSLLNSILEISRVEDHRVPIHLEVFSPAALFTDLICLFNENAQAKSLPLHLHCPADLPDFIEADQEKIRRILANLLSNAVKFTHQGSVRLAVQILPVAAAGPGHNRLVAEVIDTGTGIAAAEIPKLFQRFHQTSSGHLTGLGAGLGLFISHEYARLMGGQLTVQSRPAAGSTFRLEVPVRTASGRKTARRSGIQLPTLAPDVPCRILIADDIEDNREMLRQLLKTAGFETRTAANGLETLQVAAQWHPHLILMDAHMPELDGWEVTRRLRVCPDALRPEIIMVSASAFESDRQAARDAGADKFVAKPYRDLDLLELIRMRLNLQYIYPAAEGASTVADLGSLPAALRAQLREAVIAADYDCFLRLLEPLRASEPRLTHHLTQLASHFEAETLLHLLPAEADGSPASPKG